MKKLLLALGIGLALLAGAGAATWLWFDHAMTAPIGDAKPIAIVLEEGATYDHAEEVLTYHGLNPHPLLFNLRSRQRGVRGPLRAGQYDLNASMSPDQIMDALASGPDVILQAVALKLQVIPGENIWQVAQKLQALGIQDTLQRAADPALVRDLKLPAPARLPKGAHTLLEGYVFPDTYHLARNRPTLAKALQKPARQFRKVFTALKVEHAKSYARLMRQHNFTDHDFVTMASLIEKEVRAAAEAPLVAAVFYNRLTAGMMLQTDPTMVYGPKTWQETPSPLFRRDALNAYNTYKINKLPPGPICNPGRNALAAALAPAASKAVYFVAMRDGTGKHAFAETLEEHRANVVRYLK